MSGVARITDGGGNVLEIRSEEIGTPAYCQKIRDWKRDFIPAPQDTVAMIVVGGAWVNLDEYLEVSRWARSARI